MSQGLNGVITKAESLDNTSPEGPSRADGMGKVPFENSAWTLLGSENLGDKK